MFLVKIVMFLKRSWLPDYQLLDVEDLGGIHQSSSWNAEGYQCTLCLCEGKLSNRPGAVEGGHPLLCSSEDDSLSAGTGRGAGMRKQATERAAWGTFQASIPPGLPASIGVPLRSAWLKSGLC